MEKAVQGKKRLLSAGNMLEAKRGSFQSTLSSKGHHERDHSWAWCPIIKTRLCNISEILPKPINFKAKQLRNTPKIRKTGLWYVNSYLRMLCTNWIVIIFFKNGIDR